MDHLLEERLMEEDADDTGLESSDDGTGGEMTLLEARNAIYSNSEDSKTTNFHGGEYKEKNCDVVDEEVEGKANSQDIGKNQEMSPFFIRRKKRSFRKLIIEVLQESTDGKLKLQEIYKKIGEKCPKLALKKNFENSIRHNLSLHKDKEFILESKQFTLESKPDDMLDGKGGYWRLNPNVNQTSTKNFRLSENQGDYDMYNDSIISKIIDQDYVVDNVDLKTVNTAYEADCDGEINYLTANFDKVADVPSVEVKTNEKMFVSKENVTNSIHVSASDFRPGLVEARDESLQTIFSILKPLCESVRVHCEKKTMNSKGWIQIYNPLSDMDLMFFPTLNLIIYIQKGTLYIKLYFQQRKIFRESTISNIQDKLVDTEKYKEVVRVLAAHITDLRPSKYQVCQGFVTQEQLSLDNTAIDAELVLIEREEVGIVYRSRKCAWLSQESERCESCSEMYRRLRPDQNLTTMNYKSIHSFIKSNSKSYKAMIVEVLQESPNGKLRLNEIYQNIIAKYPLYAKHNGFQNSIRHNLSLNSSSFFILEKVPDQKGGFWMINPKADLSKVAKNKFISKNDYSNNEDVAYRKTNLPYKNWIMDAFSSSTSASETPMSIEEIIQTVGRKHPEVLDWAGFDKTILDEMFIMKNGGWILKEGAQESSPTKTVNKKISDMVTKLNNGRHVIVEPIQVPPSTKVPQIGSANSKAFSSTNDPSLSKAPTFINSLFKNPSANDEMKLPAKLNQPPVTQKPSMPNINNPSFPAGQTRRVVQLQRRGHTENQTQLSQSQKIVIINGVKYLAK